MNFEQIVTLRLGEEIRKKSFCSHLLFIQAPGCYAKQHLASDFITEAPQRGADSALLQVRGVDAATHWGKKLKKNHSHSGRPSMCSAFVTFMLHLFLFFFLHLIETVFFPT